MNYITYEEELGINGHYRSIVNKITVEYLDAIDGYERRGYHFLPETAFHCCRGEMRDQFMTAEHVNELYRIGRREKYRDGKCSKCECNTYGECRQTDGEVDRCINYDYNRMMADAAAESYYS